jgi:hypothetical protein
MHSLHILTFDAANMTLYCQTNSLFNLTIPLEEEIDTYFQE